jgi:hypothetical protein
MAENISVNFIPAEEKTRVLPLRKTSSDWHILTIHYSVVPDYDFVEASKGLSYETIRQEFEIDWSSTSGLRVYPEFGREHHVATEPLEYNPNKPLYCGWDFGGTPAFVPTQINAFGQWLLFPSVSPPDESTLGAYEFAQIVHDYLVREYALPSGKELKQLKIVHYGDPAGAAPPARVGDSPKEVRSVFDIIYKGIEIGIGEDEYGNKKVIKKPGFGWRILPGKVGIPERLESVRSRLTTSLEGGIPALVVDPRAEVIKEGFLGGYHRKQYTNGEYDRYPEKNFYSHTFDAFGYIATRLFERINRDDEEDEDNGPRYEFVSHAASRYDR